MKFGKVDNPEIIDFTIPPTHPDTAKVLDEQSSEEGLSVYVGCAKWNRADLKGFYPRGFILDVGKTKGFILSTAKTKAFI